MNKPRKQANAFVSWLRDAIKRSGKTQRQISQEAGVGANDLSRWKNGLAVPGMNGLMRLAYHFARDPRFLFSLADKPEYIEVYDLFSAPDWGQPAVQSWSLRSREEIERDVERRVVLEFLYYQHIPHWVSRAENLAYLVSSHKLGDTEKIRALASQDPELLATYFDHGLDCLNDLSAEMSTRLDDLCKRFDFPTDWPCEPEEESE